MILSERITELVRYSGLSIPKLAEKVGFKTPQTIRELIKGNTKSISDAFLYKVKTAFPEIREEWLLTGEGEMIKPKQNALPLGAVNEFPSDVATIPFVPIAASASFVESLSDSHEPDLDSLQFVPTRPEKALINSLYAFEVEGESMLPTLQPGSVILTKKIPPTSWHFAEGVVVVVFRDMVVVKRIRKNRLDQENRLDLASDNESYGSMSVQLADIRAIFKAVRVISAPIL